MYRNSTSNIGIKMEAYFKDKKKPSLHESYNLVSSFKAELGVLIFISSNLQPNQNFTGYIPSRVRD